MHRQHVLDRFVSERRHRPRRRRGTAFASLAALGASTVALLVTAPVAPAQALGASCVPAGLTTTCTYSYSGGAQYWTVPPGVTSATFEVVGAAGGRGTGVNKWAFGGVGGGVRTKLNVVPMSTIQINVGGHGGDQTGQGGWNGGGNGAGAQAFGGGGGGASDVRTEPYGLGNRFLVGGGGGGAGSPRQGYNGGYPPGAGGNGGGGGGFPGPPSAAPGTAGLDEHDSTPPAKGGAPGYTTAGAGGAASGQTSGTCNNTTGVSQSGAAGNGAVGGVGGHVVSLNGSDCYSLGGWGGGGGGGWFGGGGGADGVKNGAGGGGGSGFGPEGSTRLLGQTGADGVVKITFYTPSTDGWVDQGINIASGPTVARRQGTANILDVFYLDAQSKAWQLTYTDGVPAAPVALGGQLFHAGSALAAVSWGPGRIDVFGRAADSSLLHSWWDNGTWSGVWETLSDVGRVNSNPTVSSFTPGRLDIFARGAANDLQHKWYQSGWSGWESLGGNVSTAPSAVSWGNNRIDVLYGRTVGSSTLAQWKVWDPFNGGWQPETVLASDEMRSAPAISSSGSGKLTLYYRDASDHLRAHLFSGGGWGVWQDLTADPEASGYSPSATWDGSSSNVIVERSAATGSLWARTVPAI